MILGYFLPARTFSIQELEQITAKEPEKASWEMPFAIWLVDHGFDFKQFTTFDFRSFQKEGNEYVRREYGKEVADWQMKNSNTAFAQSLVDEFLGKVSIVPRRPTLTDIQDGMKRGCLARVMVDAGTLNNLGHYVGHSVVVTGYDHQYIWFHDPGLPAFKDRKASYEDFQKAMDNFGGEMNLIRLKR